MKQVNLLILDKDVDAVTECLGKLGLLEPKPVDSDLELQHLDVAALIAQWGLVEERCEALVREATGAEPRAVEGEAMTLADALTVVEECEAKAAEFRDKARTLAAQEEKLGSARTDLGAYRPIPADLETLEDRSFLHFAIGTMSSDAAERFAKDREEMEILLPFTTNDGEEKLIAISTRKGRWGLESDLEESGFTRDSVPVGRKGVPREIMRRLDEAIAQTAASVTSLEQARDEFRATRVPALAGLLTRARLARQFYRAQEHFVRTDQMCLISGWAREGALAQIENAVGEVTDGRVLVEHRDPDPDDPVPTCMENPKWLKPFERLIAAYGMPGYTEVEPTLVVAVTFLLMFGLMFGDVGQGAVIALAGVAMLKVPKWRDRLGDVGVIFVGAGLSAMFFGVCYGSVFAFENIIPPLWISPIHDIPTIMLTAVGVGAAMISLGLVLNVVNCWRRGDYLHAVLDKFGVVGALLYWTCLVLLVKHAMVRAEPVTSLELGIVLALTGVLFFRVPIFRLVTRRKRLFGEGVAMYFMESLVELLETFSGFLANTVSFVRVSAYALAHAGLSAAIFGMAEQLWEMPAGGVLCAVAVVVGNVFIILLEGLIVAIQSVRLEYYEFFGKFFKGEGRKFEPFHMTG